MNTPAIEDPTIFRAFAKMPRLHREVVITEKLDGTNAQITIAPRDVVWACLKAHEQEAEACPQYATAEHVIAQQGDLVMLAGSRTRWIRPKAPGERGDPDNHGFAAWVAQNASELFKLGLGTHYGEWFGAGINRGYGLQEKRFALFNTARWLARVGEPGAVNAETGEVIFCCHVVPTIWRGTFDSFDVQSCVEMLRSHGSFAVPGYRNAEGIVVFHTAANHCFKVTLENDAAPKGVPGLTSPLALAAGREAANEAFRQKVEGDKPFVPLPNPCISR